MEKEETRERKDTIEFEWDEKKNAVNIRKHGIGFEEAATVFFDPGHAEIYDNMHSGFFEGFFGGLFEDRWKVFGLAGPVPVMVSCTERNGRIRIISARKATHAEEEAYYGKS